MNNFCAAPWHSILINWNGDVYPDSQYKIPYGNISSQSLSELFQTTNITHTKNSLLNNLTPKNCINCEKKEKTIGHSRRQFFHDVLDPLLDSKDYETLIEPDIYFLEFNISNVCNLKCRMCSGQTSTAWIKDEEKLLAKNPIYHRPSLANNDLVAYTKLPMEIVEKTFQNPDHFKNLCYISLKGGEPYMEPANKEVMKKLIDMDIAKNITLDITTNGTIIDKEFDNLTKEFKSLKLHISIEGINSLYEYIRGGDNFSLEDLTHNIKQWDVGSNARVILVVTISAYNIFDLHNIWSWYESIKQDNFEIYFTNVVVRPDYLNPHVLPMKYREKAVKLFKYVPAPGIEKLQKNLLNNVYNEKEQEQLLDKFIAYTNDLDSIRKTDIRQNVPELRDLFK